MPNHDYRELAAVFAGRSVGCAGRAALSALAIPAQPGGHGRRSRSTSSAFLVEFHHRLLERSPLAELSTPVARLVVRRTDHFLDDTRVETISMIEHGRGVLAAAYSVVSIPSRIAGGAPGHGR